MTTTGGGSRPTCRRRSLEAAVALPEASLPGGRSRPTFRLALDARRRTTYLFCRRYEATVPPTCCLAAYARRRMPYPASVRTTGGGRRPTCRLALDARRRMTYLFCRRYEAAVALLAASPHMRGGCRHTCHSRRQLKAIVDLPVASP